MRNLIRGQLILGLLVYLALAANASPAEDKPVEERQEDREAPKQAIFPLDPSFFRWLFARNSWAFGYPEPMPKDPPASQGKSPFPPLDPVHEKYLDDILKFWESSNHKIAKFKCKFERWEYDPIFGPPKQGEHSTFSAGVIMYEGPAKWSYRVEKILRYSPPKEPGEKAKYVARPDENGEHWWSDGECVVKYDYANKKIIETQLPPEMKDRMFHFLPLPFLVGISAERLRERFWIHVVTPETAKGEYWLELFPRFRADAAWFKKVEIIIDERDFLPKAIQFFAVGYNEPSNPARTVFVFSDRTINPSPKSKSGESVISCYFPRSVPKGWERIVEELPGKQTTGPPVPKESKSPVANDAKAAETESQAVPAECFSPSFSRRAWRLFRNR